MNCFLLVIEFTMLPPSHGTGSNLALSPRLDIRQKNPIVHSLPHWRGKKMPPPSQAQKIPTAHPPSRSEKNFRYAGHYPRKRIVLPVRLYIHMYVQDVK